MRLHRFFVDQNIGAQTELSINSAELVNQVRRVFRLKKGDSVVVFDGSGSDYECRIEGFGEHPESVTLAVVSSERSRYVPARDLYLYAAVVKKDTFEWIVEKATELGVTHIIPVMAERSEKKSLNEARLRKIAVEASEQSGRGSVPTIMAIEPVLEAINGLKEKKISSVAFHTDGNGFNFSDGLGDEPLAVFIGPEGGWSEDELDLFHKNKIPVVCLGPQVLRAETAVIAALSQVVFIDR